MGQAPTPRRFLFIRTFKFLKAGGPIPPLGLLYLAACLRKRFGDDFQLRLVDTGLLGLDGVKQAITEFNPDYIGISSMSCEEDYLFELSRFCKQQHPDSTVIVGGPHATVRKEALLSERSLDYLVFGEGEETLVELLEALENKSDPLQVAGIAARTEQGVQTSEQRAPIEDLDALPFPAWDLIDAREYARFPNWNGSLKKEFYAVLASSRGCPYGCFFCHNLFGKTVRARSPESVFAELKWLHEEYGVEEVHILDDIFNFNAARATRVMELVLESKIDFAFAFPNGLRADIMTEELIRILAKAGTYKINYGFETASPRLQKLIGKNLNVEKAARTFELTSRAGIITGAYFMLGFPTQTRAEIEHTIDFAAHSALDVAYFFKATPYPGSGFFNEVFEQSSDEASGLKQIENYGDYHFYSVSRSYGEVDTNELNLLMLQAQHRFYFRFSRIWRVFWKSSKKMEFLHNLLEVFALLIQSFLLKHLLASGKEKTP